ncbi:hypothetical protein FOL47_003010 [Perkinsus chesapeaki]|uniref:ER-bound oxygenase mpaB/mpaB'/Rubber oxygenase catalytic domain-containing protein n=1 Tax=Perkinsus chesapeaki TaxID=330153 RepID=A0A7J6MZW4_PERCH|nr:hypothetical protein FOL47_003010 [Perkinsus chesapeaki]
MATAVLPRECPRESLVRYDPPQDVGEAPEPPVNPEEDELDFLGIEGTDPDRAIAEAIAAQLTEKAELPPMDSKPTTEDVLHILLPPREWADRGRHIIQHVNNQPATRLDVIQLQEALDERLMERQARETGICPVREELYGQCFDELIRQVTLDCPERGLLLLRIRNEIRMTIAAYQTLSSQLNELREKKRTLKAKLSELERRFEAIERRETERNNIEERKRKEEIDFLRHQGQHLETFLKGLEKSFAMTCPFYGSNYALPFMPPERCQAIRDLAKAHDIPDDGGFSLRDLDTVTLAKVARGVVSPKITKPDDLPSWVNPDGVRRGQNVFNERGRALLLATMVSLMLGSADVLLYSPDAYCKSSRQTCRRFRDTAAHITSWCLPENDLFDPGSTARKSLLQVRAMHLVARRRDLAIVLLAFSGMAVYYIRNDVGCDDLSDDEIDAYIHLRRYIGWLLGIADDYNPCSSVKRCSDCLADLYLVLNLDAYVNHDSGGSGEVLYNVVLTAFSTYGLGMGAIVTRGIPCIGCTKVAFAHPKMIPSGAHYLEVYLLTGLFSRVTAGGVDVLRNRFRRLGKDTARRPSWYVDVLDTFLLGKGLIVEYLTFPLLKFLIGSGPPMILNNDEPVRLKAYDLWRQNSDNLVLCNRSRFLPDIPLPSPMRVIEVFFVLDLFVVLSLAALSVSVIVSLLKADSCSRTLLKLCVGMAYCPCSDYALPRLPEGMCPALKRIMEGHTVPDKGSTKVGRTSMVDDSLPKWLDKTLILHGQEVFGMRPPAFLYAMLINLVNGARISRFADVLIHSPNGYANDLLTTCRRYKDTVGHVAQWMTPASDLFDPNSDARKSLRRVRVMHNVARNHINKLGRCDVGVPVSQFDMALALLAFSGMAVDIVKNDLRCRNLTPYDIQAYIHLCRFIGYLLGLEDEFNPCNSVEECSELVADLYLMLSLDSYNHSKGPSSGSGYQLFNVLLNSFGYHLMGLGPILTQALLAVPETKSGFRHPLSAPIKVYRIEMMIMKGFGETVIDHGGPKYIERARNFGIDNAANPSIFSQVADRLMAIRSALVQNLLMPIFILLFRGLGRISTEPDEERRLAAHEKWRRNFHKLILTSTDEIFESRSPLSARTAFLIFFFSDIAMCISTLVALTGSVYYLLISAV